MKSENYSKRKGDNGESIFETYLRTQEFDLENSDFFEMFDRTIKIKSYLHPIKIHHEDDFGLDFDVELFSENTHGNFEPSGVHFFFQLKTLADRLSNIKFKDFEYLSQQQTWGRRVLVVWQHLDDKWKIDKIQVLDFSKWCTRHNKEIQNIKNNAQGDSLATIKNHSVPVTDEDWEELSGEWLKIFVENYKKSILLPYYCNFYGKELGKVIYSVCRRLKEHNSSIKYKEVGYRFNDLQYPLDEVELNEKTFAIIGCHYDGKCKLPDWSQNTSNNYINVILPDINNLKKVITKKYDGWILITFDKFLEKVPGPMRNDIISNLSFSVSSVYTRVYLQSIDDLERGDYYSEIYKFIISEG